MYLFPFFTFFFVQWVLFGWRPICSSVLRQPWGRVVARPLPSSTSSDHATPLQLLTLYCNLDVIHRWLCTYVRRLTRLTMLQMIKLCVVDYKLFTSTDSTAVLSGVTFKGQRSVTRRTPEIRRLCAENVQREFVSVQYDVMKLQQLLRRIFAQL